jgi:hypothetical protein
MQASDAMTPHMNVTTMMRRRTATPTRMFGITDKHVDAFRRAER